MAARRNSKKDQPDERPAPMTPPDCDVRGATSMMLDLSIFDSDFAAISTGDQFKAGITLYGASYGQVPGGSLPTDDRLLAYLSKHDLKTWRKLRDVALHGWVECSDGRLYHRITSAKVLIVWIERLKNRLGSGAGNQSRHESYVFDPAPLTAQIEAAMACLERVDPESRKLRRWRRSSGSSPSGSPSGGPNGKAPGLRSGSQGIGIGCKKDPYQEGADIYQLGSTRGRA